MQAFPDSQSAGSSSTVNRDVSTRAIYQLMVGDKKRRTAEAGGRGPMARIPAGRRREMARRPFPGSFHSLISDQLPTIDLILIEKKLRPWEMAESMRQTNSRQRRVPRGCMRRPIRPPEVR